MSLEIREKQLKAPIDVAEYLFRRLRQVGIQSVHGVPGDYNLVALDYIPKCDLRWVGNCNELNAAYAADGYARVNGLGALVTAFGVGELSAINGVAGSFSEYVPVIHIVGQPNTISQKGGMLLHHTLGNGDFEVFSKFSSSISCYVAKLLDPNEIPTQIDAAIRECYIRSRPVYITLPTDQVQKKVEGARLETPIDLSLPKNDEEAEDYVVDVVLKYLEAAKSPVILVDACAIRHHCLDEVHALVSKSGLPTFVAPMGKGAVDETLPNYGGVYAGSGSPGNAREHLEASDLILSIGAIKSDFNTSGFTYRTSRMNTIDFHSTQTSIRWSEYPGVGMKGVLRKVVERMDVQEAWHSKLENKFPVSQLKDKDSPDITHSWFWPAIGSWLKEDDIVVTETGTANFGIWEARFPRGVMNISQVLWGSIGYSVGAAQGAALAAKELGNRRVILFVGDGSFQLTAQEVSTMIRNNLTPIIFVICNNGYTIERYIHGWEASYNDVQPWKYKQLVPIFGGRPGYYDTHSVSTQQEILELFANEKFSSAKTLQFVELNMPQEDVPAGLKLTAEAAARLNRRTV